MKTLRWLLLVPVLLVLGLLAFSLALPMLLYTIAVKIYNVLPKLTCWGDGKHKYDIYGSLFVADIKDVECTYCHSLIPEKDMPALAMQQKYLRDHIKKMAEHLQTTKEETEISGELSKLS